MKDLEFGVPEGGVEGELKSTFKYREEVSDLLYVIGYVDNPGQYLDQYDCSTECLMEAQRYDDYDEAEDCRKDIDVAYLFKVIPVRISTIIEKIIE